MVGSATHGYMKCSSSTIRQAAGATQVGRGVDLYVAKGFSATQLLMTRNSGICFISYFLKSLDKH